MSNNIVLQTELRSQLKALTVQANTAVICINGAKKLVREVEDGERDIIEVKDEVIAAHAKALVTHDSLSNIGQWIREQIEQDPNASTDPILSESYKKFLEHACEERKFDKLKTDLVIVMDGIDKLIDAKSPPYEQFSFYDTQLFHELELSGSEYNLQSTQPSNDTLLVKNNRKIMNDSENRLVETEQETPILRKTGRQVTSKSAPPKTEEPSPYLAMNQDMFNQLQNTILNLQSSIEDLQLEAKQLKSTLRTQEIRIQEYEENKPLNLKQEESRSAAPPPKCAQSVKPKSAPKVQKSNLVYNPPSKTRSEHRKPSHMASIREEPRGYTTALETITSDMESETLYRAVKTADGDTIFIPHTSASRSTKSRYSNYESSDYLDKKPKPNAYKKDNGHKDQMGYDTSGSKNNKAESSKKAQLKQSEKVMKKERKASKLHSRKKTGRDLNDTNSDSNLSGYDTANTTMDWIPIKLPPFKMPTFSGENALEYKGWRMMFQKFYGDNPKMDSFTKLMHLKQFVTGGAETLLKSVELCSENLETALSILDKTYKDNVDPLEKLYLMFEKTKINQTDYQQMLFDVNRLASIVFQMRNANGVINTPSIYMEFIRKLPTNLRLKMLEKIQDKNFKGDFEMMYDWLSRIIQTKIRVQEMSQTDTNTGKGKYFPAEDGQSE